MKLEDEIKQATFDDDFGKSILNILVTADKISSVVNATLKPFGISKEQYNVLRILRGQKSKPSTIQNIMERMISKSSNATRLVEKMRSNGLVKRALCESDRRKVDIVITQKGLSLLKKVDPLVRVCSETMKTLSNKETKELNRLLDKMRE